MRAAAARKKARRQVPSELPPTLLETMRKSRGLSLQEVGDAVGTHPTNLLKIENGTHQPKPELALKLFAFYDRVIPLSEIYFPREASRPLTCPCCQQRWSASNGTDKN